MCPSDKPAPHSAHIAVISIQAFDPELIINLSSEFLDTATNTSVKTIHGTMPGVLY